jgi:hypothetical protein
VAARTTICGLVIILAVVTFHMGSASYDGADHRCADYTWEHTLAEWDQIEKEHQHPVWEWEWVPLNIPNPPGDLSHGGFHEEWRWYKVYRMPTCNWLRVQ